MKTYVFEVDIEQEEGGRWSAVIPALPGCNVQDTPERKHWPQSATTVIGATQWTEEDLRRLGVL